MYSNIQNDDFVDNELCIKVKISLLLQQHVLAVLC